MNQATVKSTALAKTHREMGAKMVPFSGWEMPLQYESVVKEHLQVREKVGIFDVSHMGRIDISGKDAEKLLTYLSTNQIAGKQDGSCTYTVWCHENGGCVDDLIVYRIDQKSFFVIVNAGNREKDLEHLKKYAQEYDVQVKERYEDHGILAIQGPWAKKLLLDLLPDVEQLKMMRFKSVNAFGEEFFLANAGYTGSGGFEVYGSDHVIVKLWNYIFDERKAFDPKPVGLGARDTLRLEMGLALYGHEIDDEIAPNESVCDWVIKWKKDDFLGKKSLLQLEESGKKRFEHGITLIDRGIVREGAEVWLNQQKIGRVTSGTYSPSLQKAIAIVLIDRNLAIGEKVQVMVREKKLQAQIVQLPFIKS